MPVAWGMSIALLCGAATNSSYGGEAHIRGESTSGRVGIKTWKDFRDDRVVKQQLDYSCGAASLATLLKEYYGHEEVTELDIIQRIGLDGEASFADMARVAEEFGYKAVGLAMDFETLAKLQLPAIVYLELGNRRGDSHFSVLRGVAPDGRVWLGDPAWGNRLISKADFLRLWHIGSDDFSGKILVIVNKGDERFLATWKRKILLGNMLHTRIYHIN